MRGADQDPERAQAATTDAQAARESRPVKEGTRVNLVTPLGWLCRRIGSPDHGSRTAARHEQAGVSGICSGVRQLDAPAR